MKDQKGGERALRTMELTAGSRRFTAEAGADVTAVNIAEKETAPGVFEYTVLLSFAPDAKQGACLLRWHLPMREITGFWSPGSGRDRGLRQWWAANAQNSSFADGAPVIALFRQGGGNRMTAAVSEAVLPVRLTACVNDFAEREQLDLTVSLFEKTAPAAEHFSFTLRLDEREIPFENCVRDVSRWWRRFYPWQHAPKTDFAGAFPCYSTWYACHQHPTQAVLERELPPAAALGFKSMIIDDGWSYPGEGTGDYRYCGEWTPDGSKFPDLAGFAAKARALGMQTALWFPLPFVGTENKDFARFAGRLLCVDKRLNTGILDPRYPAVRAYIAENLLRAVRAYGLDGFKLDFLTDFQRESAAPAAPEMDCASALEGEEKLLEEIGKALYALRPQALLEFRQYYIGPAVARHCNLLRVCDCAFDVITNRLGIVDLRLLSYPLAVHSDMLLWARDETPENCAVMLQNTLFAVPQVSVLLQNAPAGQLRALQTYLAYWTAHRELLLWGDLYCPEPESNAPAVWVENEEIRIVALYAPRPVRFDGKCTDVFNAAESGEVFLAADTSGFATTYNCFGEETARTAFAKGSVQLPVPRGGRLRLDSAAER